ncbi:MAG: hypothetical protein ACRD25_03175 [Terracidiphilus sp.]
MRLEATFPQGLKPEVVFDPVMYGLKPVPFMGRKPGLDFDLAMYGLKPVPFSGPKSAVFSADGGGR